MTMNLMSVLAISSAIGFGLTVGVQAAFQAVALLERLSKLAIKKPPKRVAYSALDIGQYAIGDRVYDASDPAGKRYWECRSVRPLQWVKTL